MPKFTRPTPLYVFVLCVLALISGCRSTKTGAPDSSKRTPIEKPWTKAAIEAHEYLWFETSTGRSGFVLRPTLLSQEAGDFLSTKDNEKQGLPLTEFTVLDAVDEETMLDYMPRDPNAPKEPIVQNMGLSVLALWGAVVLFLPTILLIILLA